MTAFAEPSIEVIRRRDRIDRIDDRKLRAALDAGRWTKITAGAFVRTTEWRALSPLERHRLRVLEVTRRMRARGIVSHFAAAAIWRIDVLGAWPTSVDITCAPARGGRSSGAIRRHPRALDHLQLAEFGGHLVTTPAQTALDLARVVPYVNGVAIVDQAIRAERTGGPLTTIPEMLALPDARLPHRGDARAMRAISFADPHAANVRESQSRVVIAHLGFPRPQLQERRVLRSGRLVFGDFYWLDHDHWGELDGEGKYRTPEFGAHRDAAEIAIDEKNRENEIRREVRGFARWEPSDADNPRQLYDILTSSGLPSALPRP
jgi:hypothetical protein